MISVAIALVSTVKVAYAFGILIVFRVEQWPNTNNSTCSSHVHSSWRWWRGKASLHPPGWSGWLGYCNICEFIRRVYLGKKMYC